jgi:hypothetical protein
VSLGVGVREVLAPMNKDWANEILIYCINLIRGGCFRAPYRVKMEFLIDSKDGLEREGFWWQSRILGFWIHRFQGLHEGSRSSGEGDL